MHLGNVANNAYVNAKILNRNGYDCDVISYDYYHLMSTPEWEDAIFNGLLPASDNPDWDEVKITNKFTRPSWFTQGPVQLCIEALIAKRSRSYIKKIVYQSLLKAHNQLRICTQQPSLVDKIRARKIRQKIRILEKIKSKFPPVLGINSSNYDFDQVCEQLVKDFKVLFPKREDQLSLEDLSSYRSIMPYWIELFAHYDVIQAYGMEPIIPLLAGKKYVAYEHGTIRHRPWQDTVSGRLIAIAYAKADALHMTNADSIYEAQRLTDQPGKIIKGLHGLDPKRIEAQVNSRPERHFNEITSLTKKDDCLYFFAPARQNWELKGNDVILYAVSLLKQKQLSGNFKILMSDWGQDVALSKSYIEDNKLEDHFEWIPPLSKLDLIKLYSQVDGVFDQFKLPAMGGISPEVMALGQTACITRIEQSYFNHFYGEDIPLIRANNEKELAQVIENFLTDKSSATNSIAKSKSWFDRNHSEKKLIDNNLRGFEIALSGVGSNLTTESATATWRLLNNPYPYKSAIAFSTDCEFLGWPEKLELFRFLNGPGGLGIEVSNSLFFYATHSMCHSSYSYFQADHKTPQDYVSLIHEMNHAGYIDTIHAYGDFDTGGFKRTYAQRVHEVCKAQNLKFGIYSNHGSNQNFQNMGHLQLQNYQNGDNPESEYYHADILDQIGVRYYWVDDGLTPQPHYGNTLYTRLCRDQKVRNFFQRYRGLPGRPAPNAGQFHLQVKEAEIDLLCELRKSCVYYQHLGVDYKRPDGTFAANKAPFFGPEALQVLEYLARKQSDKDLLIAGSSRLLDYLYTKSQLRVEANGNKLILNGTCSAADLNGISMVGPAQQPIQSVAFNGVEIPPNAYKIEANSKGEQIVYFPWQRLEEFQW